MIIDVHAHLGYDHVFDEDFSESELLFWSEKCGIDHIIVQPSIPRPYVESTREIHDTVYDLCKAHSGRIFGMASISPHFEHADYDAELNRCVKELGFVGVKITPVGHAALPDSRNCMHVYETCTALDIPVMIHTGPGGFMSDPIKLLNPCKQFPRVKFIFAHSGGEEFYPAALFVAQQCENVYLDTSWLNVYSLKKAINSVGSGRIMFASDMPMNAPVELTKFKTAANDPAELEQMLFKTANEVFGLML